ncbi:hypothetical protein [Stratiformator vulcanicus]|uniref:Uncharacterized protein n=1 Tax=Stratiformator vulcanicus TaxID=2527980 RepID=A0A517QXN7_9PLAN|nr:hypothetical protein [Stratiformator vulcanicus]QDT36409.1 hypothetical protein Pan189_07650 [Stratiformator vulcanicus]
MIKTRFAVLSLAICGLFSGSADAGKFERFALSLPIVHHSTGPLCRLRNTGYPNRLFPWADCTYDEKYSGYYVGGGDSKGNGCRYRNEGTFGVDYDPWYSRVSLGWLHGRRLQNGYGVYEADHKVRAFPELHGGETEKH